MEGRMEGWMEGLAWRPARAARAGSRQSVPARPRPRRLRTPRRTAPSKGMILGSRILRSTHRCSTHRASATSSYRWALRGDSAHLHLRCTCVAPRVPKYPRKSSTIPWAGRFPLGSPSPTREGKPSIRTTRRPRRAAPTARNPRLPGALPRMSAGWSRAAVSGGCSRRGSLGGKAYMSYTWLDDKRFHWGAWLENSILA